MERKCFFGGCVVENVNVGRRGGGTVIDEGAEVEWFGGVG